MTKIYDKLEIPEPSANLEDRIIAAATSSQRKFFFPKLAAIAACMVIVFVVLQPQPKTPSQQTSSLVTEENILSDIEFYDDQYGFAEEIS